MLELGVKILICYLLGSLNGSLLLGRLSGVDIRSLGSGNAGGTNALRTQGKLFAFFVMLIDIGKGYLPVVLLPGMALLGVALDPDVSREWLTLSCAGATVIGHCYPVWFGFAGGKGAATSIGVLLAITPGLVLPAAGIFAVVLLLSGFVGLATMCMMTALPIVLALTQTGDRSATVVFLVGLALFIIFTHRSNIQRMLRGEENRMNLLRRSKR